MGITEFGEAHPGLDQYAINKFGVSMEVVPRTLAQNAGMDATEVIAEMHAAHKSGKRGVGIDVENCVTADCGILDLLHTKREAIKMATEAAVPAFACFRPAVGFCYDRARRTPRMLRYCTRDH